MSEKRYIVRLLNEEREELLELVKTDKKKKKRKVAARKRIHAQVLRKVDQGHDGPGWTDTKVAEAFDIHLNTVKSIRQRFVEEGMEAALNRRKQRSPSRPRKIDGAAEARLIATVQGPPPEGRTSWSLRLLSDKIVELGITDEPVSHAAIGRALKKTS